LTGRVEDAVNGVEQLRRRLEQINSDIDVRFSQGQAQSRSAVASSRAASGVADAGPAAGAMAMRGAGPDANPGTWKPPGNLMPPDTLVPPPPDPPMRGGTLTPPGQIHPGSEPATLGTAGGPRPPARRALPGGSASEQYDFAFGLLKQADYPAAEEALRHF